MNKETVRKVIIALLGIIVLGLGIGMMSKVGIGTDSMTAVQNGISAATGLSLGTVTAILNAIMCIIGLVLCKKNVGLATVLFIFVAKFPIDFAYKFMYRSESLIINIILFIISVFIVGLGSALFIVSDLGANAYDAITLGICYRLKKEDKFVLMKYILDGLLLVVAIIIGGPIGLGTVISLALVGIFISFWRGLLEKVL